MAKKLPAPVCTPLSVAPEDLVADVRALVGAGVRIDPALLDAAMRGWSYNTRRAFRSDLTLWGVWCRKRRVPPADATPELAAAWLRALSGIDASDEKPRAMATIERYLVHVGWAYRMAGLPDPTAGPLLKFERKAARKILGARQRQAHPIRFKGDIADLDSPASGICIAHLLFGGITRGALLRRVVTHFDGSVDRIGSGSLHANSVALIFKRLVRAAWEKKLLGEMTEAHLERMVAVVSSHSIRVGVAQDNFAAGEGLPAIM